MVWRNLLMGGSAFDHGISLRVNNISNYNNCFRPSKMTVHYTYPSIAKNLSKVEPQINSKIAERSIKGL